MKNLFLTLTLCILGSTAIFAQIPYGFNYQAVARDTDGNPLADKTIGLRISLWQNSVDPITGYLAYQRFFKPTTNEFGLFSIQISDCINCPDQERLSGDIEGLQWGQNSYFLQVEMSVNDTTACNDTTSIIPSCPLMGTQQLLSVPYAMYAENAGSITDSHWEKIGDNLTYLDGNVGIGNTLPRAELDLRGGMLLARNNLVSNITNMPAIMDENDDFFLLKPVGTGSNSDLRLYIEDDEDDSFSIYGNSCAVSCNDLSQSQQIATFTGGGNFGLGTPAPVGKFTIQGDSLNDITIKTSDNNRSQGIAFQNSSASYTWNIFRRKAGTYTADLVFAGHEGAPENNPENLTPYLTVKTGGDVEVSEGDVYVKDATKGIILTDVNGDCWRVTIDASTGELVTNPLANCP